MGTDHAGADQPLTADRLADLHAGLLDDDEAARLREQIRTDPAAQHILRGLSRVRGGVAALGSDAGSAPDAPAHVVERIHAALRSASLLNKPPRRVRAAHAVRPGTPSPRAVAAVVGLIAVVAAIGVGTAALLHARTPAPSAPPTAQHITVSSHPVVIPLSPAQVFGLLDRSPDYGALRDPGRRSSCLRGLGYPGSAEVIGAQPATVNGLPVVLLVLPGDTADAVAVVAVSPNCSSANTGLVADTLVRRPQ